jgi:hypothetical protein
MVSVSQILRQTQTSDKTAVVAGTISSRAEMVVPAAAISTTCLTDSLCDSNGCNSYPGIEIIFLRFQAFGICDLIKSLVAFKAFNLVASP